MKSVLAKMAIRKAVGLYLGEHEATACKVAATPLGPVQTASSTLPCTADTLPKVIEELLGSLLGGNRRVPVAVGLPNSRLFFGTRLTATEGTGTPESLLQKALCTSNIAVDELTVDMLRGDVNRSPVACVAACRRKYIASVVAALDRVGVRPFRTEPAPCALVRWAAREHRPPRFAKAVLRVMLGATQGMAAVMAGGLVMAWRTFVMPADGEALAILSAARTLQTQARHYGIESRLDYVMIHGRADLHERLRQEGVPTEMGTRVLWYEGPAFDGASIALGLALGCLVQNAKAFDLSRSLKARASIRDIFPWGDLALTGALIAGMGITLSVHSMKLDDARATVRAQSSGHKSLDTKELSHLEQSAKELDQKVEVVRKFLESRILWSCYTHDTSVRLPKDAVLGSFTGSAPMESTGSKMKRGRKMLSLQVTVPLESNGATPRNIDAFLVSLRNNPLLKRDFPNIQVTGIQRSKASATDGKSEASFGVICTPKAAGKKEAK